MDPEEPQPPASPAPTSPRRKILNDAWKGLAFTALLLTVKFGLQNTPAGMAVRRATYGLIQYRLTTTLGDSTLPVAVVDTESVPQTPVDPRDPAKGLVTDRDQLRALILAVLAQKPTAIGVDVDFSPDNERFITPKDPAFFAFCLKQSLQTRVPIYLGIERTVASARKDWLGRIEFAPLAASLLVPKEDTRQLLNWTQFADLQPPCKSLSAALAQGAERKGHSWPAWVARGADELSPAPRLEMQTFPIDYGAIERIQQEAMPASVLLQSGPDPIRSLPDAPLHDRVVLLGDAIRSADSDMFPVPGRSIKFPGVLLHACGVSTLLRAPVYEPTLVGQLLMDLILVTTILGTVTAIRFLSLKRRNEDLRHAHHARIHHLLTAAVVAAAFICGVMLVHRHRLLWDDFPLVAVGLLSHRPIELIADRVLETVRHRRRAHGHAEAKAPELGAAPDELPETPEQAGSAKAAAAASASPGRGSE